jgi:hypothetical protein
MENNIHNTLETTLKLYEFGKKNIETNREKALLCFKKALDNINLLKSLNVDTSRLSILQTTETECFKFINLNKNIFRLIEENNIDEIKKIDNINFREINSEGNTVLHHCIKIGDTGLLKELLKKGGCIDQVNGNGNTLLEYACLNKDPNLINFLLKHGANMNKHLFFRKNFTDAYLNKSDIDSAILLKLVIKNCKDGDNSLFSFLEEYFSWNELVGLNKHTIMDLSIGLTAMFKNKKCYDTYKKLIIDDLENHKGNNIKKGINKVDLILYNLIPFINYPYNVSNSVILKNELKYLIKNTLKKNKNNYKNILLNDIFDIYIKNDLFPEDYIGILVYQLISKLHKKLNF